MERVVKDITMKLKKAIIAAISASLLGATIVTSPATASVGEDEAQYLNELNEIAGQSVQYAPSSIDGTQRSAQAARAVDPYVCILHPSRTHLRKSGGYGTVGAKPYTTCAAGTPSSISQTSTLYIVEWAGLSYKPMQTKTSSNRNQKKLEQKNVAWTCKNSNDSTFQQKTNGVSVQAGKSYYSTVTTVQDAHPCGY